MTPSPHYDSDFQSKVIEGLTDLRTKMNKLVGVDGNNGDFSELKATVDTHETYIQRQTGAGGLVRFLWSAIIAILTVCAVELIKR